MSYSGLGRALLLTVALSACAHGSSGHTQASSTPANVEAAGTRHTDGPTSTRLRSAFLAGEARRDTAAAGGAVYVEQRECDVWADAASERCDTEALLRESITPGYRQ